MNCRHIVSSLVLAAAAGCAGGGGAGWPPLGDALKLSYYRQYPKHTAAGQRTSKPEPTYRVILSESWRGKVGDNVFKEPFDKAAPGKVFIGYLQDSSLRSILSKLADLGVGELVPSKPEDYLPKDLYEKATSMARDPRSPDPESAYTRLFTVGTDAWARTYYFRHNQNSVGQIEAFRRCETFVYRVVDANSIHVETKAPPIFQKPN